MSGVRKIALDAQWRIENMESWLRKRDDVLYSPQLFAETLTNTHWKLSLTPNWQLAEKYLSLTLQRDVDEGPKLIDLRYELSFLRSDGSPLKSKSCAQKFALKSVSEELNVRQAEILVENNEVYLPEGVLTVCCKIWNNSLTVSKGQCSILRSVIGTKCMNLNATVDNFSLSSCTVVNFLCPSTDINLISLDIFMTQHGCEGHDYGFVFKRKHVECKKFCWYSFTLFALGAEGCKLGFYEIINSTDCKSAEMNGRWEYNYYRFKYFPSNRLTLQLEVSYSPGIVSESTESKLNNYEILPCEAVDPKASDSKLVHSSISDGSPSADQCIEEGQSSDEDKRCDDNEKMCLPLATLKEAMTSLYNDRIFCDTKLRTDTETFPAHRCILSARSTVFKKMFLTDMKEKADECVNVPDISSDTVRRMLQYLYTDCTGDLEIQSAKDLYTASDKYDIASLKQICSSFMKKNLCPDNVCEVLVLADMHQDKDLESAAQEYVLMNDEEVFYSDEWKLFMKDYSGLAAQVMYLKCTKK